MMSKCTSHPPSSSATRANTHAAAMSRFRNMPPLPSHIDIYRDHPGVNHGVSQLSARALHSRRRQAATRETEARRREACVERPGRNAISGPPPSCRDAKSDRDAGAHASGAHQPQGRF